LMFRRLDLVPLPWRRGLGPLAIDVLHAGVWAVATSTTYDLLDRREVQP
jgi:hypothetical protein